MTKKYLSLDEAAQLLGMPQEELVRLREKGEIRGFADRGTWKFKQDDVDALARRRQADSSPEVPLYDPAPGVGEQPTVIRRETRGPSDSNLLNDDAVRSGSDSDVRLVGSRGQESGTGTDSDIKLRNADGPLQTDPEIPILTGGSDSDVKLVRPDSDSDVKLSLPGSDSDVKLSAEDTGLETSMLVPDSKTDSDFPIADLQKSDSDVRLVGNYADIPSDVSLLDDDDALAIDFNPDSGPSASVLDDESGISLGGGSSILLGESGISLAGPSDSGIGLDLNDDEDSGLTLALDDESGISLDAGESGISLEAIDSGISLHGSGVSQSDDRNRGTLPMMDIMGGDDGDQTNFEIPALDDGFDSSDADVTGVMDIHSGSDDVFTLDDEVTDSTDHFEEADLDLESEGFDDDQDLDVFEGGDAFEGSDDTGFAQSGVGRLAPVEAEWGTGMFIGLVVASLMLLVCGAVMIDLVKHTATSNQLNPVSGKLVEMIGGQFKS
ncbi:helix-turn-helix domain-containing protein [Planctomicrobium sp. SH527]|uniref:helix-turn-helix domain-containing protein n=1 Tax=Planctomicrobium sp. SH527 TaxID=3448123 RepID=UPI003F5B45E9